MSPGTVFRQRVDHPHRPAATAASSRPLWRGRAVCGDSPDTVHGKETGFHGAFGETDKSLPPTGHRIDGESPPWGRRLDGEGMEQPAAPVSCVSPKTSFHASSRPTPAPLSPLSSMPSRKKPHHAAVTRGIPHEDGGSVFIQIPVTPRNLSTDRPWTVHGEVYQTSEAVGLMASTVDLMDFQ